MNDEKPVLRPWEGLGADEQTDLCIAFGHYLDGLPLTCSMDTKIERFRSWLDEQGVQYGSGERSHSKETSKCAVRTLGGEQG